MHELNEQPPLEEIPLDVYDDQYNEYVDQPDKPSQVAPQALTPTQKPKYDIKFNVIEDYCKNNILLLAQQWVPNGSKKGNEYVAFSPFRSEKNPSFSINLNTGAWSDFAGDHKGNKLTSLYHSIFGNGKEYRDSMLELGQNLGIGIKEHTPINGKKKKFVNFFSEPPTDGYLKELGTHKPTKISDYHDFIDGEWHCVVKMYRFEPPNHKKIIKPLRAENNGWTWGGLDENRPLYNLQNIVENPDKPIIICEGEKAVNAASELLPDFIATTSMGGTSSFEKTDWLALEGREIWLWPDNDEAGLKYAADVFEFLEPIAKTIHILKPPKKKPKKWDAANALAEKCPSPFSEKPWNLLLPFDIAKQIVDLFNTPEFREINLDEISALRTIQDHVLPTPKDSISFAEEIEKLIDEDLIESQLENCTDKFSKEQVDTLLWEVSTIDLSPLQETSFLEQIKDKSDFKINILKRGLKGKKQADIVENAQQTVVTQNEKDFYKAVMTGDSIKYYLLDQSEARNAFLANGYADNWGYNTLTEDWYEYNVGLWKCIHSEIFLKRLDKVINDNVAKKVGFSNNWLNGVFMLVKKPASFENWEKQPNHLIPFKNGVLNLQTMELLSHDPQYHFTWQLPYNYEPQTTCQPIIDWFYESVNGDENQVQVLRAYLQSVLTGRYDLERYLEIIGEGGSGKSTFAWLCQSIVGVENTRATDFNSLESNRFEMSSFYGKRLILLTDESKFAGNVANFKKITGGDSLRYEDKHKSVRGDKSKDFIYTGMVLVIANQAIKSSDYTSGLGRRRLTLYFNNTPTKIRKLKGESGEFAKLLPGLVNWVLAMPTQDAENILRNGDKIINSLVSTRLDNLKNTNPLFGWLDDNCAYDPDGFTPTGGKKLIRITENDQDNSRSYSEYQNQNNELYPNYCMWCDLQGKKPISLNDFSKLLEDLCQRQLGLSNIGKKKKRINGKEYRGFTGISLNFETSFAESANLIANDNIEDEGNI